MMNMQTTCSSRRNILDERHQGVRGMVGFSRLPHLQIYLLENIRYGVQPMAVNNDWVTSIRQDVRGD